MNNTRRFFISSSLLGFGYLIYKRIQSSFSDNTSIQSSLNSKQLTDISVPPSPTQVKPDGSFTEFETNTLPSLINGTNDIKAKNTLGFEVFPAINGQAKANLNARFLWGNGVEFLNHSGDIPPIALSKGLATGFDNSFLNTVRGVPSEHRYKWTIYNDFAFWQKSHTDLEKQGAIEYGAIRSQSMDADGKQVPFGYTMLDIEAGVTDMTKINAFLKGYYTAARADNPKHTVIFYGYKPNKAFTYWHNGYYYDGDNVPLDEKFFPFTKPAYNKNKVKANANVINNYFRGKDLLYNIMVSYPKVNLPITSHIYQKDENNQFLKDRYGNRVLRNDSFQELQRGEVINFSGAGNEKDISSTERHNYGDYRLKSEVFHAVNQFGGYYAEIFFRLQMLAKECGLGDDFQNIHAINNAYKTVGILRHDLEANTFTNVFRPIDRVTSDWHATMIYTLLNNLLIWTGVTNGNIGLTLKGAWLNGSFIPDLNTSSNEGTPFKGNYLGDTAGRPKNEGHLGNYRQWAAKMYQIQAENRVYGLWQKSDKILCFTHPEQIINGQFPLIGRLQGNILKLHGVESKLDLGESFSITIKNTQNDSIITKNVESKKVLNELITLPVGKYNAQDIIVEYTNPVKGGLQRVNGRAETIQA